MKPAHKTCANWSECGIAGGGCCAIDAYEKPSFTVCTICEEHSDPKQRERGLKNIEKRMKKIVKMTHKSRGLGDTVKKIIDKVTFKKVKQCGGCQKRQEALNKLMPYGTEDDA